MPTPTPWPRPPPYRGKLDEFTAAGASEETLTAQRSLIEEIFGFENPPIADAPLKTRATVQEETLSSLMRYLGRRSWTQLTTEEKEWFADAIDAEWEHDAGLGRVGHWWCDGKYYLLRQRRIHRAGPISGPAPRQEGLVDFLRTYNTRNTGEIDNSGGDK